MKLTTVSVQDQDGRWQQLGAGALRGVWPENVEVTADVWGPRSLAFDLHRDPDVGWPDLQAYLRVEAQVAGVPVGQFRITDAPTRSADTVISVHCEGLQFHLDDDQYERVYVHTNVGDYQDARSFVTAPLTDLPAGLTVSSDHGLVLSFPKDVSTAANARAAAFLDLGPACTGKRVVMTYEITPASPGGSWYLLVRGYDDPASFESGYDSIISVNNPAGGTVHGSAGTARRFIGIELYNSGTITGLANDVTVRVTSIQVFADTAYESGDASVLRGDHVVTDALDKATMLLSSDRSRVEQTSGFYLPEFAPDGPRTPRQAVEAADVFYARQCKVDEQGRMVYRDRPTTPALKVGAWGSSEFEDASAASGEDVYSRVIVQGQDPVGQPVRAERTQSQQPGTTVEVIASPSHPNPSFASDASGWSVLGSSITRDTSSPDSAPASGRWDATGASDALSVGDALYSTFSGTFRKGVTYVVDVALKASAAGTRLRAGLGTDLTGAGDGTIVGSLAPSGVATSWTRYQISWTPQQDYSGAGVYFALRLDGGAAYYRVDSLTLLAARPTVVEKRGFRRTHTLDSGFTLTDASAARLGDVFLQAHRTTPFKGRGQVTGNGSVRDYLTGMPVGPERLLLHTGEPLHFDDRLDPDTGALGRDGRLVQVTYKADTDTATFDIDSSRGDFDRTLQRAGVLVGQLR